MTKRVSPRTPIIGLGMIVAGLLLGWFGGRGAFIAHLTRYTFGDRGPAVDNVRTQLPAALASDVWLIAGYGLALAGCAIFFRNRASSELGRRTAGFVVAAVVVAVLADLAEDWLLSATLPQTSTDSALVTATIGAAIVKFCALSVAVLGVPAAIGIMARGAAGMIQARRWQRDHPVAPAQPVTGEPLRPQPWWEAVLADDDLPDPSATDEAVRDSGETVDALKSKQQSWIRAYNVPGVTAALKDRADPLRALCLSGGGVRSSCVAMGAMEVFSRRTAAEPPAAPLLDGLDYVISVSGGGYAAGARLLAVQAQHVDLPARPSWEFPSGDEPSISQRFEAGSAEFDHVRRGSSYIADSPLDLVRALAQVLKNLLASLATVFIIPIIAGSLAGLLLAYLPIAAFPPVAVRDTADDLKHLPYYYESLIAHPAAYWALGFFLLCAAFLTMVALTIEWRWAGPFSERCRATVAGLARMSAGFALVVFGLTIALPGLMRLCVWASDPTTRSPGGVAAALSGVVGLNYVAALVAMIWRKKDRLPRGSGAKPSPSLLKRVLPPAVVSMLLVVATLAVLLVVWLALLGSFATGVFQRSTQSLFGEHLTPIPHGIWWLLGLLAFAGCIGCADVTSLSLHPFYRRRLARTFAVRRVPGRAAPNWAERYPANEPTWLNEYGSTTNGPKFVFACAATITGQGKPAPGLNAVSYVLSAEHVGGPELGWFKTGELFQVASPRIRRDLTVEAAVAVSGAAFASSMGRQDKGIEKLLAISGARLGTWLPNPYFVSRINNGADGDGPDIDDDMSPVWPKSLPTIRGASYLYREILGINSKEARLVQITDGGHYDNSGLVEALRRRCRLIIVVDGGGDPPPLAIGLADALRLAKYELGVDITLRETGDYSIESISPGSGTPFPKDHALACLNKRITRGGVVAGTITYPAAAGLKKCTGDLVVAKAVVSQASPYWLSTYAATSDVFPHDPTSDQWFSEGQFAAYTELGRVIGAEVLDCLNYLQAERATPTSQEEQGVLETPV